MSLRPGISDEIRRLPDANDTLADCSSISRENQQLLLNPHRFYFTSTVPSTRYDFVEEGSYGIKFDQRAKGYRANLMSCVPSEMDSTAKTVSQSTDNSDDRKLSSGVLFLNEDDINSGSFDISLNCSNDNFAHSKNLFVKASDSTILNSCIGEKIGIPIRSLLPTCEVDVSQKNLMGFHLNDFVQLKKTETTEKADGVCRNLSFVSINSSVQRFVPLARSRQIVKMFLKGIKNLQPRDIDGQADPYVYIRFVDASKQPVCHKKYITVTKAHTLNPKWNEVIEFDESYGFHRAYYLHLQVR